jgi:hypothetical protein
VYAILSTTTSMKLLFSTFGKKSCPRGKKLPRSQNYHKLRFFENIAFHCRILQYCRYAVRIWKNQIQPERFKKQVLTVFRCVFVIHFLSAIYNPKLPLAIAQSCSSFYFWVHPYHHSPLLPSSIKEISQKESQDSLQNKEQSNYNLYQLVVLLCICCELVYQNWPKSMGYRTDSKRLK